MLRGMVFMDHMNFDIELQRHYTAIGERTPKLDYSKMFNAIAKSKETDFLKAFIFAPEPDGFLVNDEKLLKNFKWLQGMANAKYTDVIFGRYVARPTKEGVQMDISDRGTYYKVEKGTDINLAINLLSKAQYNSYDIAFVMSADTDYINVYRLLKSMGKIVVAVALKGQNLKKVIPEVDDYIMLDKTFFDKCIRS